jgi:hypothetical protein
MKKEGIIIIQHGDFPHDFKDEHREIVVQESELNKQEQIYLTIKKFKSNNATTFESQKKSKSGFD